MNKIKSIFIISSLIILVLSFQIAENTSWESKYVTLGKNGSLKYIPDEGGNIIPDFSRVGYHQGNKNIPNIPVRKTINPAKRGSSQEIIQQAINEMVVLEPDENGYRGAILLKKGIYYIPGTLHINTSGIVLRGEGDNENGTRLIASGKGQRTLLSVSGSGNTKEIPKTRRKIADEYVPAGAMSFTLESAAGLKAGDKIILFRPGTDNWISDLKMDRIIEREGTRQWQGEDYNLEFERVITKIEGKKIFIDNPVVMAMETKYGGGEIYKYSFDGRISEVGIENILFVSEYAHGTDEDHGWIAIGIDKTENSWVSNVTSRYFGYAGVSIEKDAKQITVKDSKSLAPKSIITGGRRYSFNNNGQLNLFMNLHATEGRHDYVTGARVSGPNVFYNCTSTNAHSDIGPHHRWATGTLYDNIVTDGDINVQDRGNWGSGHGWAGVTQVIWNCIAKKAAVQSPWVTGKNYCIGLQGEKYEGRLSGKPDGEWEGRNTPGLQPESLYKAQLKARQNVNKGDTLAVFDITDYGAVGDGKKLNSAAIQRAIDDCHKQGGGKVMIPEGHFLTGTIVLKDNVTLYLKKGGVLLGSIYVDDYKNVDPFTEGLGIDVGYALLVAVDAKNIGIEGEGAIDGQGSALKAEHIKTDTRPEGERWGRRPFLLRIVRCTGVTVKDATLKYAGAWTSHYFQSRQILIENVKIESYGVAHNDGIGIDGCQDVRIKNCDIESGDDALVFKTTSGKMACSNIVVSGMRLKSRQAGIKMGTESMAPFENIMISDCYIYDTRNGGIKLLTVDGAHLRNVEISDVTMENVRTPMLFRLGSRLNVFREGEIQQKTGTMENVTIKNVKAQAAAEAQLTPPSGILITGVPGHYIAGLTLDNIEIDLAGGGTHSDARESVPEAVDQYPEVKTFGPKIPAYGIWARHVNGLKLNNIRFTLDSNDLRPAFVCEDGKNIALNNWQIPETSGAQAIIRLEDVEGADINNVDAKGEANAFVLVEGESSKDIEVAENKTPGIKKTVKFSAEVKAKAALE